MRMRELYTKRSNGDRESFRLSFELFPPKNEKGYDVMWRALGELSGYDPAFVSVTYGAGGTTQNDTLAIAKEVRERFGHAVTAHFTCVGSTVPEIRQWLTRADELEIDNIMALRGDPPKGTEKFVAVEGGFRYASELVDYLRREFPRFGIGVAGYPETHQEALSADSDLENLKRKVDAGGEVVFTQLFYDNEDFFRFRDRCEQVGIDVPIVPGLMPVLSFKQIQRITAMCKARLPDDLVARLEAAADDADAQVDIGIEHATRQTEGLLAAEAPGIHFYVLNRATPTLRVLADATGWGPRELTH